MTKTEVTITGHSGDSGWAGYIQCPDCGDKVTVFESPFWEIKCSCKVWELEIKAVGQPIKG